MRLLELLGEFGMNTPEEFEAALQKEAPGGCWLWQKSKHVFGYGQAAWRGKHRNTHRIAWELGVQGGVSVHR
jgi:hypothetical protein